MAERAEKQTTLVAGFVDANAALHFFASLFYAEYQPASHILKYVNAGHNPPIVLRGNLDRREVVPSNGGGVPVGIFEDSEYSSEMFQLEIGDVPLAYTDGITESQNLAGDPFGHERLLAILCDCDGRDPQEILQRILGELPLPYQRRNRQRRNGCVLPCPRPTSTARSPSRFFLPER